MDLWCEITHSNRVTIFRQQILFLVLFRPCLVKLGLVTPFFHGSDESTLTLWVVCLGCTASGTPAVSLKIVFLPLLTFEAIVLIDNFRYRSYLANVCIQTTG